MEQERPGGTEAERRRRANVRLALLIAVLALVFYLAAFFIQE